MYNPTNPQAATTKPAIIAERAGQTPGWYRDASATEKGTPITAAAQNEWLAMVRDLLTSANITLSAPDQTALTRAIVAKAQQQAASDVNGTIRFNSLYSGSVGANNATGGEAASLATGKTFSAYQHFFIIAKDTDTIANRAGQYCVNTDLTSLTTDTVVLVQVDTGFCYITRTSDTAFKVYSVSTTLKVTGIFGMDVKQLPPT